MILNSIDSKYMRIAIKLAKKGEGKVNPNPLVGAVIVKKGEIISKGYHRGYGQLHAERDALNRCIEDPNGATMYVTLEPCCHHGKNPPCTDAIIESGIKKIVVGSNDPNPLVMGRGFEILKEKGIDVVNNFLKDECDELNDVFFHFIKNKTPYVVMKYAMTIDGKIATSSGKSKWITNEKSRYNVHLDRNKYSAIMVGIGTVMKDDPMLDCRIDGGRNPIRIICDSHLRISENSKIVKTAKRNRTIIVTKCRENKKIEIFKKKGCEILLDNSIEKKIDLNWLMNALGSMEIDSILLEGGSQLNWSALNSGIVNKVQAYISPKIFAGENSPTPISGAGILEPSEAIKLVNVRIRNFDEDFLIEGEVKKCLQE